MCSVLMLIGLMWAQGTLAQNLASGSPLKVAQCRAKCIHTFPGEEPSGSTCLQNTNCNTCWEQCQRLGAGWSALCDKDALCHAGCQQACRFHLQLEVQRSPVLVTRGEEVILVSGDIASWPPPGVASPLAPHVFVLMCRLPDNSWTQVTQTVDLEWRVPGSLSCGTVRVMVVGLDGLVTVYSPAPRPLQDAGMILRSVGRESWLGLGGSQDNRVVDSSSPKENERGWNMREVSLIHQGVLVIAEVAWDPPAAVPAVYLVTWELAGGGLKGNLLTDSTCVTLSLWPDTVYRIQVQLVREPQTLSEVLVLDTRQAAPLLSPAPTAAPTTPGYGHPGFEGVAGAASALLVFFAVALVFSTRRRSSLPEKPLEVEELHSSNHFKLFPPPVRLLVEPTSLPVLYPVGADSQEELTLSRSDPTV
ncbi:uncharacterized protein LOC124356975 [Homalodisca vitripennis]|uniref:uncharacterized protein LOC124356975 n=1 Tax=Homalodisca vitripennis TaxID=197043 RepID=UPI001EEA64A9|nr:uncharacterized protein LOC124356975 [Homalodisca vitripennis]